MKQSLNLDHFFKPKSIAVLGASRTPGKVGYAVIDNLKRFGYKGRIYPVNPNADQIHGMRCYGSVTAIRGNVDLAIIIVRQEFMFQAVEECGKKGIDSAIIISAGFKETDARGAKIERRLIGIAKSYNLRIQGPNCLGLICPGTRLNASFAQGMPENGNIAFLSQSGALCTAILDWAIGEDIGFSKFVSLGNKSDLTEIEFIRYLEDDPESKVILIYQEGIEDGQRFMEVAREVVRTTPIIVLKSGGSEAGARAASSHTGSLAGSDRAYNAAFKQAGILRAPDLKTLFDYALAFASQPIPVGPRIGVLTNAGGPGILATDAIDQTSLKMADFTKETIEKLRASLPPTAAVFNPVDIIGDGNWDRYQTAGEIIARDPNVEGLVTLLAPQAMLDFKKTAQVVIDLAQKSGKPVLASFMGKQQPAEGIALLREGGVPNYTYPEDAVAAMDAMCRYRQLASRPPAAETKFEGLDRRSVRRILDACYQEDRINLSEIEAKEVFSAYGIPTTRNIIAEDAEEAVKAAESIGYPVVLKILSPDILHKTDVGGVALDLQNEAEVHDAYHEIMARVRKFQRHALITGVTVQQMIPDGKEIILGMSRDPQFGPLIMFGLGGIYVEVMRDVSFRIAPLSGADAEEMVQEIRGYPLLTGFRGEKPADREAIVDYALRLSRLVTDFPEIEEVDLNPIRIFERGKGGIAIDARIILKGE